MLRVDNDEEAAPSIGCILLKALMSDGSIPEHLKSGSSCVTDQKTQVQIPPCSSGGVMNC